jgi:hypothetical protein
MSTTTTRYYLTSENHIELDMEAPSTVQNEVHVRHAQSALDDMYEPSSDAVRRVVDQCAAFLRASD